MGDVFHAGRRNQGNQRRVGNDVTNEKQLTDKQLEILHDHYKETFARMLVAEASRDRLFLWVIALFALLSLEIGYPAAVGGALGKLSIAGGELNLQALPLPALLNATWVLTLTIGLRYCQASIFVGRQYPYLHTLEDAISPMVGGGDLYRREGKVYLREYPLLLEVAWIAYGILFPLIIMFAALGLTIWELTWVLYPRYHIFFDAFIAAALICFYFLYRVQPTLASQWRKWKEWRTRPRIKHLESKTTAKTKKH
jgi:hypothetical protein